jgi:hypothetical protein
LFAWDTCVKNEKKSRVGDCWICLRMFVVEYFCAGQISNLTFLFDQIVKYIFWTVFFCDMTNLYFLFEKDVLETSMFSRRNVCANLWLKRLRMIADNYVLLVKCSKFFMVIFFVRFVSTTWELQYICDTYFFLHEI